MSKKLVRLTEDDLHRIIKESVNNVLTELDWRTYANAAKKAREQGRDSRWDFDRATERELNKQYGGKHIVDTNKDFQSFKSYPEETEYQTGHDYARRPLKGYEKLDPYSSTDYAYNDGSVDIADFVNGKYDYQKGKGWTKK